MKYRSKNLKYILDNLDNLNTFDVYVILLQQLNSLEEDLVKNYLRLKLPTHILKRKLKETIYIIRILIEMINQNIYSNFDIKKRKGYRAARRFMQTEERLLNKNIDIIEKLK